MGETLQFPSFRLDKDALASCQSPLVAASCSVPLGASVTLDHRTIEWIALAAPGAEKSFHRPLCVANAKAHLAFYHFCQLSSWAD